jgi:hypothetical protein
MHLASSILDAPSFGARFFDAAPNSSVCLHLASMRPCLSSIFLASTVRASTLASMLAFYWMLLASSILDAPRFGARFFDAPTPRFDASMPRFDTCFDPGFEARFDNRRKVCVWSRQHSMLGFDACFDLWSLRQSLRSLAWFHHLLLRSWVASRLASTRFVDTHFDTRLDTRCFDASTPRLNASLLA